MSIDLASLLLAAKNLDSLTTSADRAVRATERLNPPTNRLSAEARLAAAGANALSTALRGVDLVGFGREAIRLADAYKNMQARLGLVTTSTFQLSHVTKELFDAAQRTRSGLEGSVDLYVRMAGSARDLGASQREMVAVTETINRTLVISGASAAGTQAALNQLGDAFISGALQGDKLNIILAQSPRLAQAIADGMGVTVGQLRVMGAEGKLTGKAIFDALKGQGDAIAAEFANMPATVGQSFMVLQNAILNYVGEADQASGASAKLADVVNFLAKNIEVIGNVLGGLAAVLAVRMTVSAILASNAVRAYALSVAIVGPVSANAAVAVSVLSAASAGLARALAFFGGPIGIAITAVAAAIALAAREMTASERAVNELDASIRSAKEMIEHYNAALGSTSTSTRDVGAQSMGAVLGIVEFGGMAGQAATNLFNMAAGAKSAAIETVGLKIAAMEAELAQAKLRTQEGRRKDIFKDYGTNFLGAAGSAGRFVIGEARALLDGGEADRELGKKVQEQEKALADLRQLSRRLYAASTESFIPPNMAAATGNAAMVTPRSVAGRDEEAERFERAKEDAEGYLASLRDQNAEYGKSAVALSAIAMKEKEIAAARAAAPTLELKLAIIEQGDYAISLMKQAEAMKHVTFIPMPEVDFEGAELTALVEELAMIDGLAGEAAAGLESAFGRMGAAIGGITTAIAGYRAEWAALRKSQEDDDISNDEGIRRRASLQISMYGDITSAAKGFFDEGSKGYKALEVAERTFRAFEAAIAFANFTRKMFLIGAETTAAVGGEAMKATASVEASGVIVGANTSVGASAAAAAVASQGMGDPVTAWPRIAAMAALMAGLGFLAFGGGGGGVPGATDMEDRQKAQGSGSVLGDAEAKSESIAKALEIVAANTNADLEYSNEMLKALRSIESGIGAVAAALARSLGAGGALDTAGLNLGMSGRPATLGNLGFGSTTNRSLQDQGLSFGSQSLSEILSGGIEGQTYQQVLETKVKKAFGLTYSNKSSSTTTTGALDADLADQFTALIGSLRKGVLEAASVLGVTGAEATLDAFKVELGKLSFKDMTGTEIQEALSAIFGELGDDLAATAIPELKTLQKVGEGAFETLARVARQYQVVDTSLTSIGMQFGAVGVSSLNARERLVDLVGGIDELTEQAAYFAENFLSDLERMAPVQRAVANDLGRLGLVGIDTKEKFKQVVLGLDLTTKGGAEMYAALMDLAPAFAKVIDFQTEGSQAVQDAREALSSAYEREVGALETTRDKFKDLAKSLKEFGASLNPLLDATSGETLERTRGRFFAEASAAAGGDADAMAGLQNSAQSFLEAAKASAGSLLEYQIAVATVQGAVKAAEAAASSQATLAEQQLSALNASVSGILTVNDSVLSVRDALAAYHGAVSAQAPAAVTPPPNPGGQPPAANDNPTPATRGADWASYIAHYADVAAGYANEIANAKGRAELARLGISSVEGYGEWHWGRFGKTEGRTPYAAGGIMDRPITLGESGIGGEIGPEGILPLAKVGGKLGVHAVGKSDAAQLAQLHAEQVRMNAALVAIARSNHELNRNFQRVMADGLYVRGPEPDAPVQSKAAA